MKSLFVFLVSIVSATVCFATGGSSSGTRGGGNIHVAEFYQIGDDLLGALVPLSPLQIGPQSLDIPKFQKLFAKTKVKTTNKELRLDGANVDAINDFAKNTIVFSQKRWKTFDNEKKAQLVIHELLGLARLKDIGYQTSFEVIQVLGLSSNFSGARISSDNICEEVRTLKANKARRFFRSLLIAGVTAQGDETKTLQVPSVSCRILADDSIADDQPGVECSPIATTLAQAEVLTETFEFVGMWGESGMSHLSYDVNDINCTINSSLQSYQCQIRAYWSWGCKP